jgi:regulator of protease activity HflC (stomatin/prohibitin superfamily)
MSDRSLILTIVGGILVGLLALSGIVWLCGASNPLTDAGYVGYVTHGSVFGSSRFYGLQRGPASPGRTWLLNVVNVSITPYTYDEKFEKTDKNDTRILAKDNVAVSFEVHLIWRVKPDRVREFVEKFAAIHDGTQPDVVVRTAYDNFLKQQLRTFARDEIKGRDGFAIKDEIDAIGKAVFDKTLALCDNTPFQIDSVVVGNIQYPPEVEAAISNKLAQQQNLQTKLIEVEIAKRSAQTRVAEAEGLAKAMQIVQVKLTSQYLQHEAIEAQKAMVNSPNHTTIYIPVGSMGVPLIDIPRTASTNQEK